MIADCLGREAMFGGNSRPELERLVGACVEGAAGEMTRRSREHRGCGRPPGRIEDSDRPRKDARDDICARSRLRLDSPLHPAVLGQASEGGLHGSGPAETLASVAVHERHHQVQGGAWPMPRYPGGPAKPRNFEEQRGESGHGVGLNLVCVVDTAGDALVCGAGSKELWLRAGLLTSIDGCHGAA